MANETKAQHTPGPWRAKRVMNQMGDLGTTISMLKRAVEGPTWMVFSDAYRHGDTEADARLIAAAPEMYEALEVLVGEIEWEIGEEKWGRDPDALAKAKRVLAKARGDGAECESCGGPHEHTDEDGGTFCNECVEASGGPGVVSKGGDAS